MPAPTRTIDRDSTTPVYQQIADDLRAEVRRGVHAPGTHLPSEAKIGEMYGVTDATARKAIRVLVAEGLATVVRGKGSYVAKPLPPAEVA